MKLLVWILQLSFFLLSVFGIDDELDDDFECPIRRNLKAADNIDVTNGPFTDHFWNWINNNGYAPWKEILTSISKYKARSTGSFGGKEDDGDTVVKRPVIFIHGNQDSATDSGTPGADGWTKVIEEFKAVGYKKSELYGITYGDQNPTGAALTVIPCQYFTTNRKLLESVLAYTGAEKVNIVGHSLGATIARKIIKGGKLQLIDEDCDLGPSLANRIDTFVSLAGAHFGLCICYCYPTFASCSRVNGFYASRGCGNGVAVDPSNPCGKAPAGSCEKAGYATMLQEINDDPTKEADHIFSIWSKGDFVTGMPNNLVWGRSTSTVPNSEGVKVLESGDHYEVKSGSGKDLISLFEKHEFAPTPPAPITTVSDDF